MATNFYIGSIENKEFISLHKWFRENDKAERLITKLRSKVLVSEELNDFDKHDDLPNIKFYFLSTEEIQIEINKDQNHEQNWIQKLTQEVDSFLKSNFYKTLFLVCDISDQPWSIAEKGAYEWKEFYSSQFYDGNYLPRNLIDTFGYSTWEEVQNHLNKECRWFYTNQFDSDVLEMKMVFERILKNKLAQQ